jgi:hypothetical protein
VRECSHDLLPHHLHYLRTQTHTQRPHWDTTAHYQKTQS